MRRRLPIDPAGGLRARLAAMRGYVMASRGDAGFRDAVAAEVRHLMPRDYRAELAQIAAVAARARYTRDPVGVEAFTPPAVLLGRIQGTRAGPATGDCDDHAMLVAAMAEAIGHRSRFVVGGTAGQWRHVWTEVEVNGRWNVVETTKPMTNPRDVFADLATSDPAGLALDARPGYVPAMHYQQARGRSSDLGDLGDLDGFKLKRIGKAIAKVTRPIEKAVARVTPKPIKQVASLANKAVQAVAVKPWQQVGAAYKKVWDTQRTILAATAPIAGPIANMIAPGSGALIPLVAKKPASAPPLMQLPEWSPLVLPGGNEGGGGYSDWGPGGGGGSGGGDGMRLAATGDGSSSSSSTLWIIAAAAGALFLFTRRRR